MVRKSKTLESWHGRVVAVNDGTQEPAVAIYDAATEEVRWFPFRADSELGIVFKSMSSLGQPLQVVERPDGSGFAFFPAELVRFQNLVRGKNGWKIATTEPSASAFFLQESKSTTAIAETLLKQASQGKTFWFVTRKVAKVTGDQGTRWDVEGSFELIDLLESFKTTTCDIFKPFPFELEEKQHKPITVKHANKLFSELAAQSTDPHRGPLTGIPFLYPENGCDQRSHAMIRYILSRGVYPFKVWVHADDLVFKTQNHLQCEAKWVYHTAPAVLTKSGLYTIDPSVCDQAVPVEEWYHKFVATLTPKVYVVSHHIYFFPRNGCRLLSDPEFNETERLLAYYRNALRLQTVEFGFPPCRTV